jgi:hypothetical protein
MAFGQTGRVGGDLAVYSGFDVLLRRDLAKNRRLAASFTGNQLRA